MHGRTHACTHTHARTDNVKTVYPPQTKFAGGIIRCVINGLSCSLVYLAFKSIHYRCKGLGLYNHTLYSATQSLNNTMFGVHRNGVCYIGRILQRNYRKMIICGHFPIIPL